MTESPDPLDALLSQPAIPEVHALRARLRFETSEVVRRRRPFLRLARVAAAAACLLICLLALRGLIVILTPDPTPQSQKQLSLNWHGPPLPPPVKESAPAPPPSPVALEWAAFDSPPAEQSARYLEAGDQYAEESQDYAAALRCYRQAIASGDPAATEFDPDDNWLVMALKRDQRKEQ
jgi:hypothetical protein